MGNSLIDKFTPPSLESLPSLDLSRSPSSPPLYLVRQPFRLQLRNTRFRCAARAYWLRPSHLGWTERSQIRRALVTSTIRK
nr:hypothetical protein CFP56_56571 [Quercus suber]